MVQYIFLKSVIFYKLENLKCNLWSPQVVTLKTYKKASKETPMDGPGRQNLNYLAILRLMAIDSFYGFDK